MKRDYDTTIARIAGNIVPALIPICVNDNEAARRAVDCARRIVALVRETEPAPPEHDLRPKP